MTGTLELIYFNIRGRAEPIRLLPWRKDGESTELITFLENELLPKLEQLERAARSFLLALVARQRSSLTQAAADKLADAAKHETRRNAR